MKDPLIRLVFDHGSSFHHVKVMALPHRPVKGDFFEPTQEDLSFLKAEFNKAYNGDDRLVERWRVVSCEFLGPMFVAKLTPTKAEI